MNGVLILGSKEYPFGTNTGEDPIPSGGMETYVDDLAPELSRLIKVVIVTRKFKQTPKYEKKGNITVFRVPWVKGKWFRNPTFNLVSFLKASGVIRQIDIIYSNGIVSGLAALKLARIFRKKAVYRPAGLVSKQYSFPIRQILYSLEKMLMKKSDAVVFHSDGEKRNAEEYFGLNLKNGHSILTGFPVDKFRKASKSGKDVRITSVARFVPVKGLDVLLKACPSLRGNYEVMMVGSGPEEEKLKRMAKDMGLEKKITFTGFRHDVPEILSNTDIFVISSHSEGLPTSLLEAMAAENACVVTDIGLPVENRKTGLIVKPGDSDALSRSVQNLVNDKSLREKLGKNARRFVLDNCTQKKAAEKHIQLFRRILG